jgi:hypothetical protein
LKTIFIPLGWPPAWDSSDIDKSMDFEKPLKPPLHTNYIFSVPTNGFIFIMQEHQPDNISEHQPDNMSEHQPDNISDLSTNQTTYQTHV